MNPIGFAVARLRALWMRGGPSSPVRAGDEGAAINYRSAYEAVVPILIQGVLEMKRLNEVIEQLVRSQEQLKEQLAAAVTELADTKAKLACLPSGPETAPDPNPSVGAA